MNRQQSLFRPNPRSSRHQQAWRYLQTIPPGQKNAYIVQAILQFETEKSLEKSLREILSTITTKTEQVSQVALNTEIPDEMMGFLDNLMDAEK